ncbi:MAG TPA: SusC/RagA family TonB-linked outer membrane protein [Cyclobacteriaceae bacterium]
MILTLQHLRAGCLLFVVLLSTVLMTHATPRQEVLDIEVTISLKDVTLRQALQEIEAVAKVKFVYSRNYLKLDDKVTIEVTNKKLGQLLEEIFSPREIKFSVHDTENFVVLTQARLRGILPAGQQPTPVNIQHYSVRVSGKIIDESGNSMAGVNIVEKGTTNGTSTDSEGKYSIEVAGDATLVFSFIGYKSVEHPIGGRTTIDISMEEDRSVLDPVQVNAGYWKVSEREQTGNIARVTSDEISKQPVGNPMAALIGRMPGVNIQQSSGMPGSQFAIQIRGRNSLRVDGNTPLYIVDGVPFPAASIAGPNSPLGSPSPLNSLNPSDIESIEVLKDADATAIYGTRGANGVVLITTKKGGPGKTKLDLNVYTGIGKVGHFMKLLSTEQYLTMRHEAHKNDNFPIQPFENDLLAWDTTRYTDWQKTLIGGTSKITNAQLSFSGGSTNTQFQAGAGFYSEGTVFSGDFSDKKLSTHVSLSHQSTNKKFRLGLQNSLVIDNNSLPQADFTNTALNLPPVAPALYNEDGSLNWQNGTWPSNSNPIASNLVKYSTASQNLLSNLNVGYEIIPGLIVKSSFGYNTLASKDLALAPIAANDPSLNVTTGYSDHTSGLTQTWIAEPQLEYKKEVGAGQLTALIGSTFQQTTRSKEAIRAQGYTNDALLENIASAGSLNTLSSDYTNYKYAAFFGRLNYNLKGKYLLNLTARRDGSSRFGPERRFSNFGAIGAGWIFSEEFLKGSSILSFGKLRSSFGITGSDQIADYGYLDSYSATRYSYQGRSGLVPTRLANPDYGWEKTQKGEIALDLGFVRDRLNLSAAYYRNESSNQLVGQTLPRITGFGSVQSNLPATVRNTGVEFVFRSTNINNGNLNWTTSITLTIPRNKLVSYPNIETSASANSWQVGKPVNMAKTFHYTGVDPQTGVFTYQDLNGNGSGIDYPADLQATKALGQSYFGALTNSIQYKGFELTFMFQVVKQTGRNFLATPTAFGVPGVYTNQPVEVMNRWQKPGDVTDIQKFTLIGPGASLYYAGSGGDNAIVDASFVKLKNASLSYTLPGSLSQSVKLQSVRIYLQGQNLLTFTKFVGLDPEIPVPNSLPSLRIITGGLQVSL